MTWTEVKLGDAIHVKHGFAFKGQFFADSGTHVVLTPGNFNEGGGFRLRPGKDRFYGGDIPEEYVLRENDTSVPTIIRTKSTGWSFRDSINCSSLRKTA